MRLFQIKPLIWVTNTTTLTGLILLVSCGALIPSEKPDKLVNFEKMIVGSWENTSFDPRGTSHAKKTFYANGTSKGHAQLKVNNGSVCLYLPKIEFTSRWKRIGDKLIISDIKYSASGLNKVNEIHYDRITKIDATEFSFIDHNSRSLVTTRRIPE